VPFDVKNFKFFILGLLLNCFLFYHVQTFSSSFCFILIKRLLSTLRSYGVKASEHE
jgi:hypothetical protein